MEMDAFTFAVILIVTAIFCFWFFGPKVKKNSRGKAPGRSPYEACLAQINAVISGSSGAGRVEEEVIQPATPRKARGHGDGEARRRKKGGKKQPEQLNAAGIKPQIYTHKEKNKRHDEGSEPSTPARTPSGTPRARKRSSVHVDELEMAFHPAVLAAQGKNATNLTKQISAFDDQQEVARAEAHLPQLSLPPSVHPAAAVEAVAAAPAEPIKKRNIASKSKPAAAPAAAANPKHSGLQNGRTKEFSSTDVLPADDIDDDDDAIEPVQINWEPKFRSYALRMPDFIRAPKYANLPAKSMGFVNVVVDNLPQFEEGNPKMTEHLLRDLLKLPPNALTFQTFEGRLLAIVRFPQELGEHAENFCTEFDGAALSGNFLRLCKL